MYELLTEGPPTVLLANGVSRRLPSSWSHPGGGGRGDGGRHKGGVGGVVVSDGWFVTGDLLMNLAAFLLNYFWSRLCLSLSLSENANGMGWDGPATSIAVSIDAVIDSSIAASR